MEPTEPQIITAPIITIRIISKKYQNHYDKLIIEKLVRPKRVKFAIRNSVPVACEDFPWYMLCICSQKAKFNVASFPEII